jgi:hypothetical protein
MYNTIMSDHKSCKLALKHFCGIDDDYLTSSNIRLASSDTPYDYSGIDSTPHLKRRIISAMNSLKNEIGFRGNMPEYFDEKKWTDLLTNQIYQINRVHGEDPFAHVLIREADEMIENYYNVITSAK